MRFIYDDGDFASPFEDDKLYDYRWLSYYPSFTLEDTLLEIIWLINSKEAYEEMREYYVKG